MVEKEAKEKEKRNDIFQQYIPRERRGRTSIQNISNNEEDKITKACMNSGKEVYGIKKRSSIRREYPELRDKPKT